MPRHPKISSISSCFSSAFHLLGIFDIDPQSGAGRPQNGSPNWIWMPQIQIGTVEVQRHYEGKNSSHWTCISTVDYKTCATFCPEIAFFISVLYPLPLQNIQAK